MVRSQLYRHQNFGSSPSYVSIDRASLPFPNETLTFLSSFSPLQHYLHGGLPIVLNSPSHSITEGGFGWLMHDAARKMSRRIEEGLLPITKFLIKAVN